MSRWVKESFSFHDLQRIIQRLLDRVDVFAGLTQQELLQLLENSDKCTYDPGEAIVREGSNGAFLYIIIQGRVSVVKSAHGRGSTELARLEPGEAFGEISLVDQGERSASVIALEQCVLLRLAETDCWRVAPISAKLFRNIARLLAKRLRDMDEAYVLSTRVRR